MPFLKWIGGKTRLLGTIKPLIPTETRVYCEPFLGSGAVFFALNPRSAILSDINPRLITAYRMVRDRVDDLITGLAEIEAAYLSVSPNRRQQSYLVYRDLFNDAEDDLTVAKLFIFLNKTCYNGQYREN
jgi:DNA adenine methylase